ncbi:MAG TPA: hypothetical protein DEF51_30030, partial [Myxococcales bacterium]|nr:hypothetical protein [Myxococcales bacterium]
MDRLWDLESPRQRRCLGLRVMSGAIRLFPSDSLPQRAWGVSRKSYRLGADRLGHAEDAPLLHDIWQEELSPKWPPGSDFWPFKLAADVVITGRAFAPSGRRVATRDVSVHVGRQRKRLRVFG